MTLDEFKETGVSFGDTITVICDDGSTFTGVFDDYERAYDTDDGLEYISVTPSHNKCFFRLALQEIEEIIIVSKYVRPED